MIITQDRLYLLGIHIFVVVNKELLLEINVFCIHGCMTLYLVF